MLQKLSLSTILLGILLLAGCNGSGESLYLGGSCSDIKPTCYLSSAADTCADYYNECLPCEIARQAELVPCTKDCVGKPVRRSPQQICEAEHRSCLNKLKMCLEKNQVI